MSYDQIAHIIKIGGTVAFTGVFVLAILYALWPKNRERFVRAAHLPLQSDDTPDLDSREIDHD